MYEWWICCSDYILEKTIEKSGQSLRMMNDNQRICKNKYKWNDVSNCFDCLNITKFYYETYDDCDQINKYGIVNHANNVSLSLNISPG